jgi:hypothetical protein
MTSITLAEYLTSIVAPVVARDLKEEMGKMMGEPDPTRPMERSSDGNWYRASEEITVCGAACGSTEDNLPALRQRNSQGS